MKRAGRIANLIRGTMPMKSNASARSEGARYEDVALDHLYVDAASMHIITVLAI